LQALHRIDEAVAGYEDQLIRHPDHHEARGSRLLALNYRDSLPRETLFAEHAHYGELVEGTPAAVRAREAAALRLHSQRRSPAAARLLFAGSPNACGRLLSGTTPAKPGRFAV
jgi:hypothetical protein